MSDITIVRSVQSEAAETTKARAVEATAEAESSNAEEAKVAEATIGNIEINRKRHAGIGVHFDENSEISCCCSPTTFPGMINFPANFSACTWQLNAYSVKFTI
jgi:hypothetical protein